jgi:hypothetical protein
MNPREKARVIIAGGLSRRQACSLCRQNPIAGEEVIKKWVRDPCPHDQVSGKAFIFVAHDNTHAFLFCRAEGDGHWVVEVSRGKSERGRGRE